MPRVGSSEPVRVLVVGGHGHGRAHLRNARRLEGEGVVRLVGVCDLQPPAGESEALAAGVPWTGDLDALLARAAPEVVVVCTPIQTHVDLAEKALRAGADVLLEKPPTPTLQDHERLASVVEATGRACQVGFQTFGSAAIDVVRDLLASGRLGTLQGIGAFGAWVRDESYWARAPWAGRRRMDGKWVCDGAVTNPFAHATAAALRIDGSDRLGDLARVETELYHANPIEADDTSCVRMTTKRGTTIAVGVTLCASANHEPYVVVHGTRGRAVYWYTRSHLTISTPDGRSESDHEIADLLTNLVEHTRDRSTPLIAPLSRTGAFTEVVEAIRTASEPAVIPAQHQHVVHTEHGQRSAGPSAHRVVAGVEVIAARVSEQLRTFSELGAPWVSHLAAGSDA